MPFRFAAADKQSTLEWAVGAPLMILCIIVGAIALRWIVVRAIDRAVRAMENRSRPERTGRTGRMLRQAAGLDNQRRKQRAATMGSVLRSVATIIIFGVAALTVMARLGVPLAPLLASAGVGGVALGFGAQSLVKDFLSGIFMIMEDQYGVGDVVDTGGTIGTVEEVTLRVTRIRDFEGVVWYIRNGEILRIGNKSQGYATTFVDIPIGVDQSVEKALQVLRRVAAEVDDESPWKERLLEEPMVAGVQEMSSGSVTLRIIATCVPNEQYGVAREIRERAKMALDEAGVRGPHLPPYGPSIGT
ncbi:mechanosensitive ion channel protein MscS [Flexivirga endophytica]|uniref:Mechanosensitive ion channel protein MscS n=1 Tax=Flexivirga endophytica TaxID=1849103 RepID=A0A916WN20_9MICO|nr:mechanosensitive ion channel family protein [Flexivirga endophytica]GGB16555.1 mechanosensitive ion channel protein MscS [Flexivirga endophytica]GHB38987.1 mechanosensitive ion channel protein MscS [Flexivirga endophytica]